MFNERDIEYVGLREIAGVLSIRVSNITYYFPTKNDLVNQISLDLGQLNASTLSRHEPLSMAGFMEMFRIIFQNQVRYRCLLLSFVHTMENTPLMSGRYKDAETARYESMRSNLTLLEEGAYLHSLGETTRAHIVSFLGFVSRFWISEAAISHAHLPVQEQIDHYLDLIARVLSPYAAERGKAGLDAYFQANRTARGPEKTLPGPPQGNAG